MVSFNYQAITRLRKMYKITSIELAAILKKNPRTISVWENSPDIDKLKITVGIIIEMCNHFDLPIDFFFHSNVSAEKKQADEPNKPANPVNYQMMTDLRNDIKEQHEKHIEDIQILNEKLKEKEIELLKLRYEKDLEIKTLQQKLQEQAEKNRYVAAEKKITYKK